MRITEVKKMTALFWVASLLLITGLTAAGCAGPAASQKTAEEVSKDKLDGVSEEVCKIKDSDPVFKFKDEVITYGDIKKLWAYTTDNDDPNDFEKLSDKEKDVNVRQLAVNHVAARKARDSNLMGDNYYRAREYEMITRYMTAVYAEKVIGKEVNPTDAELLAMSPPALPEVLVRVFVAKTMDKAKEIYARVQAGEDMDALVKKESLGLSAPMGGLTRWMTIQNAEKFPAPVVQKFLDAPAGHLFEPFFQDVGFIVVRVEEKHTPEEVQKQWLHSNRADKIFSLRKDAYAQRVAELVDKRKDVEFDNAKVREILEGKTPKTQPVVKIRDMEFTIDSVVPEMMRMSASHGEDKIAGNLQKFVERAVVTEEAYSLGLDISPEAKEKIKVKGEKNLAKLLKDKVAKEAEDKPITEEDMKKYVEANIADFTEPMRWCISVMEFENQESAGEVSQKLKAGEAFPDLAKVSGVSTAKEASGAIGCYPKTEIPTEIFNEIEPFTKGQCSQEPFSVKMKEGGDRWLLVQVYDVLNPAPVPFERVIKPIVEGRIKTQRRTEALSGLVNSLADEYGYENCFINTGKENVSK
jgi:parvulin-like peptidyl-prolyl isomerase